MSIKVLVVEDDDLLSDSISDFLIYHGYETFISSSVKSALNILYQNIVDLALIDIKLLDGSGITLLKDIRTWNVRMPILMVTSYTDSAYVTECLSNGADDYIRKPFDLSEMLARIQAALRRSYPEQTKLICLQNDYQFDVYSKRLTKDGHDVSLTKKENDLLAVFCANRGQILPFEVLERAIWHTQEESSNGALRVYINSIRKLLGDCSITSIKSVGYKLN